MKYMDVTVCSVPHILFIVEGMAVFSNKSGFAGCSKRVTFEYRSGLWYVTGISGNVESLVANDIPVAHITKMGKLLEEHILAEHEHKPNPKNLTFKPGSPIKEGR